MNETTLQVKRLSEDAILPERATEGSAGYDLSAAHSATVKKRGKALIKTDLTIIIPEGYYGRIAPRSGLALSFFIGVGAGVIDSDYRGNVGVVLFNHSDQDYEVKKGSKIAQLILEKITTPKVEEVTEINTTKRGEKGFGSTDKKDFSKMSPEDVRKHFINDSFFEKTENLEALGNQFFYSLGELEYYIEDEDAAKEFYELTDELRKFYTENDTSEKKTKFISKTLEIQGKDTLFLQFDKKKRSFTIKQWFSEEIFAHGFYGVGISGETITLCGPYSSVNEITFKNEEFELYLKKYTEEGKILFEKREKPNRKLL